MEAAPVRRSPEHSFQSWVDRFIDRVVLPPMFTSGIDMGGHDFRRIGMVTKLQGRGVKFGLPDVFVAQWASQDRACWLELKRGSKLKAQQDATHNAMRLAGQYVYVCSTMHEVLRDLRHRGFELHENADALAAEYEARVIAGEQAPRTPKTPSSRPRGSRATTAKIRRALASGVWSP